MLIFFMLNSIIIWLIETNVNIKYYTILIGNLFLYVKFLRVHIVLILGWFLLLKPK